ncbi:MAG TPA: lytic transglycosylase domain-containing protein [Pyrinomonadaceae bacterium]|nr:lytic transglycosylase domain-containing protein [Pyrinomonadaceae bacterium]
MKFPQAFPRSRFLRVQNLHFRAAKFLSFAIISLFFLSNFAGFLFSPVFAPSVSAITPQVETIPEDIPLSGDCDLDLIIFRAGEKEGVDPRFIHAVIKQESRYNPKAVSHVGAEGLMQMMPATAKRFGLKDPFDPAANVAAGTKYLKFLLKRFNGDVSLALAGYNAGEGSVDKYKGVPPYGETQTYVKKIVGNYGKTYHPVLPPDDAKLAFGLVNEASESNSAL